MALNFDQTLTVSWVTLIVEGRCVSRSSEGFTKKFSKIAQKYPQNLLFDI